MGLKEITSIQVHSKVKRVELALTGTLVDRTRDKQLESIRIPVVVEPAAGETTQHQCAMEQAADFSAETT